MCKDNNTGHCDGEDDKTGKDDKSSEDDETGEDDETVDDDNDNNGKDRISETYD
jgi:hypothetical protein